MVEQKPAKPFEVPVLCPVLGINDFDDQPGHLNLVCALIDGIKLLLDNVAGQKELILFYELFITLDISAFYQNRLKLDRVFST